MDLAYESSAKSWSVKATDDLAYSVGGFQLRASVQIQITKAGSNTYHGEFISWKSQAYDAYNWDPGKAVGPAELLKMAMRMPSDSEMCCVEVAGKAKSFLMRTEPWTTTDKDVLKGFDVTVEIPTPVSTDVGMPDAGTADGGIADGGGIHQLQKK